MKNKLTFLLLLISTFCWSQQKNGVEEFKMYLMKTKTGALFVFNGTSNSFTIEVFSDKVKPANDKVSLMIDDIIFRPFVLPYQEKIDFDNMSDTNKKEILFNYMNYEFDYFKNDLAQNISNLYYKWVYINEKLFIYWVYEMPESNSSIDLQLYVTTICFDNILTFNMPLLKNTKSIEFYDKLLMEIGHSFKTYNEIIDLDKMYNEKNK